MKLSDVQIKDKYDRTFFENPKAGQFHVYNRSYRFQNSNPETHVNDIYNIMQTYQENSKPKILAFLCDNGPDFNPASLNVFFCMGELWKKLDLDQLIICSYAPHCSKFNPIEIAWGTLSQALAQITLVSDHEKYQYKNNDEDLKKLFSQAQDELSDIWSKTSYAQTFVKCTNIKPDSKESPYNRYEELKDVLKRGKNHEKNIEYKENIQFLLTHCVKRAYYLHFKKCQKSECTHCKGSPIKNQEALKVLEKFENQLPMPILLEDFYNSEKYPSFLDLINNESLLKPYHQEREKYINKAKKENIICTKCEWLYESNADLQKHKRYCK